MQTYKELMTKVAQSYEMVHNFNNFKAFVMFAVKKLEVLLILFENFLLCLCLSGKFFCQI